MPAHRVTFPAMLQPRLNSNDLPTVSQRSTAKVVESSTVLARWEEGLEAALPRRPTGVDRRYFLRSAGAAALLAVSASVSIGRVQSLVTRDGSEFAAAAPFATPLDQIHLDTLQPLTGSPFQILGLDAPVPAKLVSLTDLSHQHPASWESFSMRFRVPLSADVSQNTYDFWHRDLGRFPLFVVPMNDDGTHLFLQAIVHRQPAP